MTTANYVRRYCERFGFALTWTPPGQKGPRHAGWNLETNAIRDPNHAHEFWTQHPHCGVGVLLGFSGLVSLDVDDIPRSREVLAEFDVELDVIEAPRIVGNPAKFRLMFKAPDAVLTHRTLSWPQQQDSRKSFVVFELRAGTVSDALPPSIHVGTGEPYRWATPPHNGFPPLPDALLALWLDWENTERQGKARCPWWIPPAPTPRPVVPYPRPADAPNVIAEFNARHDVVTILEANGYQRRGKRFASPDTNHAPGVVLLESGRVYCHHAGDRLGGGKAHDAFDVYVQLVHNGNVRAAVRTVAEALGIGRRA